MQHNQHQADRSLPFIRRLPASFQAISILERPSLWEPKSRFVGHADTHFGNPLTLTAETDSDIIGHAGVGKSTFYEHFRGKNDVLLSAMQPIVLALATDASGRAARSYVRSMVEHLWEWRSVARPIMDSTAASILQRRLADAIARHGGRWTGGEDTPLYAVGIAAAQLTILRCWVAGHATATVVVMTDQLIACSRLGDGNQHP